MKFKIILIIFGLIGQIALAKDMSKTEMDDAPFKTIKNFHFISNTLASSGNLKLEDYKLIKDYGFKHVINLIPGDQAKEQKHVKSLRLTYKQISVDFSEPSLDNFDTFKRLMKRYGENKIYVHCEANYRASTFVYLYRITQLGVDVKVAKKDLLKIWTPNATWQDFIDKVLF